MSQPPPQNPAPPGVRPHSPAVVTTPGGGSAPTRPGETDPAYNDVVLSFLRKRGYQKAEEALRQDIEQAKQKAAAAAAGGASSAAAGPPAAAGGATAAAATPGGATAAASPAGTTGVATAGTSTGPGAGPGPKGAAGGPATGGAQAAAHGSHTVTLPTLVNRNAPRLTKQAQALAASAPIFDLLLQQLPSTTLHSLGLPDIAREKERKEREEKYAGAVAAGPGGVKKEDTAGVEVKVLDPQERVLGYEGVREWVESGLEAWKVRAHVAPA